jgi:glycosyltransferase involved in cell wall biosynthesis
MNIVYLYTSVNGFVLSTLQALYDTGYVKNIYLVYRAKGATDGNRYKVVGAHWLHLIERHAISENEILEMLESVQPRIVYVAGWVDKGYLQAVSRYRALGGDVQVVCGIDDQWRGTLRQYLGTIYFRLFYRKLFDYLWVSGKPQYHYAQRFGYGHENIICNLLSADTQVFDQRTEPCRRFVFVGRFAPVTGIDLLIEAYETLPEEVRSAWPLVLIGDGSMREKIEEMASENISIKPYLQPEDLRSELMRGGVACVPSYSNQWGVVIHELALLGYPMIISSVCGAATEFLISGYNGYLFRSHDVKALRCAMLKIVSLTDAERAQFAERSRNLSLRITPEIAANSLLSVIPLAEFAELAP